MLDVISTAQKSKINVINTTEKKGLLASFTAVLSAILSSACCWLPLILVGAGASVTTVAGFFEEYRLLFLSFTVVFLGIGFYFVYFRKEKCVTGSACETPRPKLKRFNKITLWLATLMAVAFALFPNYVGSLLAKETPIPALASKSAPAAIRVFDVEGMTCDGCTVHIKSALQKLPGVAAVEVSYPQKTATITLSDPRTTDASLLAAIEETGYQATLNSTQSTPRRPVKK